MSNLNLSQNSNNLNDSSKTQEKLYSSEVSLDDILTYSDDNSQNHSINKSPSKEKNSIKNEKEKEVKPPTIINSFNSEITISFLKDKVNPTKNKLNIYPKSAKKPLIKTELINLEENKRDLNKSFNEDLNKYFKKFIKEENDFDENIGNNLKDVSDFHASISNIFSEFEIKDISISKSNNDIKKIENEKEKEKDNKQNSNKNLDIDNKNQISEEHSNTNSMCNYQNISNLNEKSTNNKNENEKINKNETKDLICSDDIGEIKIKMNISLDNCNKKKFNNDKKNYLEDIIDTHEINKKEIFTTSNKKESNSFYAQNTKQSKNSLKYTKAQCVQNLFQNNTKIETKQYIPSDAIIKTKDTTSDKKNQKKIISLSPHKLSFEIQKNDCIQISYNKNKSTINNDLNENISYINNTSDLSVSKIEEMNTEKNNNSNFYNNECLKQKSTTSFMISSNVNSIQKFIHRKISYQKNNKKMIINNRNINIQKEDPNNFFYNPNHPLASGPVISNMSNNKKISNELQTPDLNKNKMTPMTCVHKGSLIYCNESNGNNNTIKYNYSNDVSHLAKGNKSGIINYSNDKKPKLNNQKKLVYLKNNINKSKNNRINKNVNDVNSKIKQATIINNKNNSFTKINNNENASFNQINKNIIKKKNNKKNSMQLIKKKKIFENNNNNNSKINNSFKKNSSIKNNTINNNSINSNNKRRIIRGINKIKLKSKSNSIINKINNEIIKESSLFHILYNNMSQRNANTTKNNSGMSSKDEKESTIIQKNSSKEKEKEIKKKPIQKKLVKHNTNNSFSLYNSNFDKIFDDNKKNVAKEKKTNKNILKKFNTNLNGNKLHKKMNSQINLDSLTSNFNFNNINNIMKRRKNNKSLYNFGNIFFINQNHIVKNNELEPSNSNVIRYINKNQKTKLNNKNMLIVSTKQPEIINDFSKYRKKKEIIVKEKIRGNNLNKLYNKQEYKETQLISEN